jgi:hypothetical protein
MSNLMKIRSLRAELFHAEGRTDGHHEAQSSFSQFYESACDISSAKRKKMY